MFSLFENFFNHTNGFLHLFSYTTIRCGFALLFSFFITFLTMPKYIVFSHDWQNEGQPIRHYLESHLLKKGTPTMGGVIIILSILITCIVIGNMKNYYMLILLVSMLAFGIIGFLDDYKKIKQKKADGISPRKKLFFQILIAVSVVLSANYFVNSQQYSTTLTFPFFRKFILELGIIYTIFRIFVIIGSSNAVNLTDGLDGLAIVPVVFVSFVFLIFGYIIGNFSLAKYLFFNYQSGANEICIFLSALIGAGIGFLWFNVKPAQIFMGDVGSLTFGGILGVVSVLLKNEFILAIAGGLFVIETLSVILQVNYFKITHGKRIFKMTPIHHHFEKSGWSETQVVVRFWIVSFLFCLIALASLKIR